MQPKSGVSNPPDMKLLTHNMLACHIRSHKHETPQPFIIEATEIEEMDADFDLDFLRHIWDRIEWDTLRAAAVSMGAILELNGIEALHNDARKCCGFEARRMA